ncbi:hypothetical protein WJX74_003939 [Apatococcus lobatus]|uniref:GH18 domain-containing protein n=1 Tax=Apatococcus lobatus TaxID=904363 RepID=A0AAW1RUE3_9CHLO
MGNLPWRTRLVPVVLLMALCASLGRAWEVFGFAVEANTTYEGYDWSLLSTTAWNIDPNLIRTASLHGVCRAVLDGRSANHSVINDPSVQTAWISERVQEAAEAGAHGINFDLEDCLNASMSAAYTKLVQNTAAAFQGRFSKPQISVDIPWSPAGVDGRNYDWLGLSQAADILFVMAYDMQSQIWGSCVASANSPLAQARHGLEQYLQLGIAADKMVLGLPWYGYKYSCIRGHKGNEGEGGDNRGVCQLKPVAFRGAPCSDAAGQQICFKDVMRLLQVTGSHVQWDATQQAPFFDFPDSSAPGGWSQVWFDDERSIRQKVALASQLGLQGVGVWNLDCLDYTSSNHRNHTSVMWKALQDPEPGACNDTGVGCFAHASSVQLRSDLSGQRADRVRPQQAWTDQRQQPRAGMKSVIKQQLAAPPDKEAQKRTPGVPHRTDSFAKGVIPLRTKLAWGAPAFATSSLTFLIAVYLTDFYVSLGASLAFLSFFTALARSCDILVDPVMGWASDNTKTAWGRRRPFMFLGCFFYAALFTLLLSPPRARGHEDGTNPYAAFWFGIFYTAFYLADTVTNVPYEALGPELSDSYDERSRIYFVHKFFNMLGMLTAALLPFLVTYLVRNSSSSVVYLDCAAVYRGPSSSLTNFPGHPEPPFYSTSTGCEQSTACDAKLGVFCFMESYLTKYPTLSLLRHPERASTETYYFEATLSTMNRTCAQTATSFLTASTIATCADRGASVCSNNAVAKDTPGCIPFKRYTQSALNAEREGFSIVGLFFGTYFINAMLHCVWRVQERRHKATEAQSMLPFIPSTLRPAKNLAFRPLLMGWSLEALGNSALVTIYPFFIRYVVISDGTLAEQRHQSIDPQVCMGLGVMGLLLAGLLSCPGWLYLASRLGKYKTWLIQNFIGAATFLLFFLPREGDSVVVIMLMFLNGISLGGGFMAHSLMADVVDYDELLNGARSEGIFCVFSTLIPKFVSIPASSLPLALINLLGFIPPVDGINQPQSNQVRVFIRFIFALLPFLCSSISLCIKSTFPIRTKEMLDQIHEGIALHQRGKPAVDPLTGNELRLLKLSVEEEKDAYVYEHFGAQWLGRLAVTGNPTFIVMWTGGTLLFCVIAFITTTGLVCYFISQGFMGQQHYAIIPITLVILAGAALCGIVVNALRMKAGLKLKDVGFQEQTELIQRVQEAKVLGQRGAYPTTMANRGDKQLRQRRQEPAGAQEGPKESRA